MSKNELIVRAEQIRDEILPDGNTAPRVGSLLIDIIEETPAIAPIQGIKLNNQMQNPDNDGIVSLNIQQGGSGTVSSILFNRQTPLTPDSNGVIGVDAFPMSVQPDMAPFLVAKKGTIVRITGTGQSAGTYTDYVCIKDYNDTLGGNTEDSGGYGNTDFFMPWLEFVDRVKNSVGSLKIDGLELFPTPNTTQIAFSIDSKIGTRINFWVSVLPNAGEAETGKKYYSEQDNHLWVVSTNGGAHWVDRGAVRSGVIYLFENEAGDDLKYICDEDSGSLYPLMFLTSMINKIEKVSVDGEELAIDPAKGVNVPVDTKIGLPVNIVSTMTGLSGIITGEFYYALDTNHIYIQPSGYAPVLDRGLADKGIIYISKPDRNKYKFDGNRLFLIGENLVQEFKAKNTTSHPHWCYTWDDPAYNLHFNTVRPNADNLNFNLRANGFVAGKIPWYEPPLGYGFYLWTAEFKKAVAGWDNQEITSTNNAPRNGTGIRGIRAATAEEIMYPDGTIFQNVYKDADRNWYSGTKIGTQMWMRENLMTTKLEDGTDIPLIPYASWGTAAGNEYLFGRIVNPIDRALPQPSTITSDDMAVRIYGYHYTSWVATNSGLINSGGWRVFTLADWATLNSYIATNYPTFDPKYWKRSRGVVDGVYNDPNLIEPTDNKKFDFFSVQNAPTISFETVASKTITLTSLTITSAGWTWNGSLWVYTLNNSRITATHNADIIPMNQESVVLAAGIKPYSTVNNGSVTLQANNKPSADFIVTILLSE